MVTLAVILTVEKATGSFGSAGLAVAAYGLGASALAPLRGRRLDRRGARHALPVFGVASGLGLAGLIVGVEVEAPGAVLIGTSAVAGMTVPPLIATARATWSRIVLTAELRPAYAFTAISGDAAQVVGPALVGVLTAVGGPSLGVLACAVAAPLSSMLVASLPAASQTNGELGRHLGDRPVTSAGLRALIATDLALGLGIGLLDLALPAFAEQTASAAAAGGLLAALALGSVIGGIWFGRQTPRDPSRQYPQLLGLLALGLLPLALAPSIWGMAPVLALAGLAFGPANVALFEALDRAAPKQAAVEAFTWLTTANSGGIAVGALAGGLLVTHVGVTAALLAPSLAVSIGAVIARQSRGRL
jgi:MFS family permease